MPVTEIDYSRISFSEALDYLSEKTNLDTDSYIEGQGIVQDVAFTVAAAKGQLLQDIRDALDQSVANGESVDKFLKKFDNIAASYTNDWPLKGGNSWRGALIYQQNIRQAYNAGRYAQMTQPDVMRLRPYWQWRHGGSEAPRLTHLALDRRVFRADSLPFHPPMGFNCACSVFSLSQRDVDRKDLKVENLRMGQSLDVVDPSNGQTKTVELKPDKGFDRIPGKSTPEQRDRLLKRLDPELRKAVEKDVAGLVPNSLRVAKVDDLDNLEAWDAGFVDLSKLENLSSKQRDKIEDATWTFEQIQDEIINFPQQAATNLRGIVDRKGNLQSVALVSQRQDRLEIDYIVKAPWNLIESSDIRVIKGVGRSLIGAIAKESLALNLSGGVQLSALPGARQAYIDMGFVEKSIGDKRYLELSGESAKMLVQDIGKTAQFMQEEDDDFVLAIPARKMAEYEAWVAAGRPPRPKRTVSIADILRKARAEAKQVIQ